MCAPSGPGISENEWKNQELHKRAATKSDLILLSPISFQLEFQTGQRCVPCAMPMPCQSRPLCPFWNNQPQSLFVKTSPHVGEYRCFHFSCIFHTGKLHYCQEGMCVPMCACAHAGVCEWVGGLRLTSGIFLSHSPTYSLKQGLAGEPRICQLDRLVGLACLRQESSTFPVLELQACHQSHLALRQVLGTWTLVLRLTRHVL